MILVPNFDAVMVKEFNYMLDMKLVLVTTSEGF